VSDIEDFVAGKKRADVLRASMAYRDSGDGRPIVFLHGNPTSSFLWRNIIGHVSSLGRCIAPDLIGMGDSAKLPPLAGAAYRFVEHRRYLDALLDSLDLGDDIVFVLHDWGSALGFDWAHRHPQRVAGIAYMEAVVAPVESWDDWPADARRTFQGMRSEEGEKMVLDGNVFVERILPASVQRQLTDEEMAEYRRPYPDRESRWPTLQWPREIPIEAEPGGRDRDRRCLRRLAADSNRAQAVHQRRSRQHPGRQGSRALPQLAGANRSHRTRPALRPGRQPGADRAGAGRLDPDRPADVRQSTPSQGVGRVRGRQSGRPVNGLSTREDRNA